MAENDNGSSISLSSFLALPISEALQFLNLVGVQVHTDNDGIVKNVNLSYASASRNERCKF